MRPAPTPDTNTILYLTDHDGTRIPDADLPAHRHTTPDGDTHITSTWTPDPGERIALANGAPIHLHITGDVHPPVAITAGEPDMTTARPLLDRDHATRAIGHLYAALSETDRLQPPMPGPDFLDLWTTALAATRTNPTAANAPNN